ncbi:hypothetical protein J6590_101350 [Homalodisca vitripennis]|nr:hypothetical protein J6590_101350 [Homalodisca vitripennis]
MRNDSVSARIRVNAVLSAAVSSTIQLDTIGPTAGFMRLCKHMPIEVNTRLTHIRIVMNAYSRRPTAVP